MGNCLVTKLKETVNNNNLPIFGQTTVELYYTGYDTTDWTTIQTNSNGQVLMTITNGNIQPAGDNKNPIQPHGSWAGWIRREQSSYAELTFESCYNLLYLNISGVNKIKGLSSVLSSLNGYAFGSNNSDLIKNILIESAKHNNYQHCTIQAQLETMMPAIPYAEAVAQANMSSLIYWNVAYAGLCSWFSNSTLQSYRGPGNLEDLPVTIRELDAIDTIGYRMTGNLNTLIQKFIAASRTSGTIKFNGWPSAFTDITFTNNGTTTAWSVYLISIGLANNKPTFISWNSQGQITFSQDIAPEDYVPADPVHE